LHISAGLDKNADGSDVDSNDEDGDNGDNGCIYYNSEYMSALVTMMVISITSIMSILVTVISKAALMMLNHVVMKMD
jgi:hypothetical protein